MGYITEHQLIDRDGAEWAFRVFGNADSKVLVRIQRHPKMQKDQSLTLVHYVSFCNDFLKQMPKAVMDEEFARARLFRNQYSWVRTFSDPDYTRNATLIGIRMEFLAPYYSVDLEKEDARRLWRHLSKSV